MRDHDRRLTIEAVVSRPRGPSDPGASAAISSRHSRIRTYSRPRRRLCRIPPFNRPAHHAASLTSTIILFPWTAGNWRPEGRARAWTAHPHAGYREPRAGGQLLRPPARGVDRDRRIYRRCACRSTTMAQFPYPRVLATTPGGHQGTGERSFLPGGVRSDLKPVGLPSPKG